VIFNQQLKKIIVEIYFQLIVSVYAGLKGALGLLGDLEDTCLSYPLNNQVGRYNRSLNNINIYFCQGRFLSIFLFIARFYGRL
jgi:hypothetical protein